MPNTIQLNPSLCDGCGICQATCPQLVFSQPERKAVAVIEHPENCYGCMACEEDCPQHAIQVFRLPEGMTADEVPAPGQKLDSNHVYDLVIIGAGPAGLGAALRARILGMDVAVIERLPSHKRVHHPDGGLLFAKGIYTTEHKDKGLWIKELDLHITADMIQEWLQDFLFIGPSGQSTTKRTKPWEGFPVVDKHAMLASFAQKAMNRGAIFAYNTRAYKISAPDSAGIRKVEIDSGRMISGKVIICAEGITGNLLEDAGMNVNQHKIAWSIAPYADLPPLPNPRMDVAFYCASGPGRTTEDRLPYLAYMSSGPHATHIAYGPIQKQYTRIPNVSATDILMDFIRNDSYLQQHLNGNISVDDISWDGCRVYVRKIPDSFSAQSLLAVGDTITTCGMLTNMLSMKTGDLAAQTAFEALRKNDTSAQTMCTYDNRVRSIQMFSGMTWMNNLLIKAPLELDRNQLDQLFDTLAKLPLSRLQSGEIMPLILFYLSIMPKLFTNPVMRSYLVPGK